MVVKKARPEMVFTGCIKSHFMFILSDAEIELTIHIHLTPRLLRGAMPHSPMRLYGVVLN
jgi:hypothetical protein